MQRPFLRRIVFPSPIPAKSPAQRRETRLPARLFPKPPRSPVFSSSRTLRIPRSPRRFRACTASACLPGFCTCRPSVCVPARFPHSTRLLHSPAQVPRSGAGSASRLGSCIPAHILSSGAGATFRNIAQAPPFGKHPALRRSARRNCAFSRTPGSSPLRPVFKKKKPPRKGALFLHENQFSHLPFT